MKFYSFQKKYFLIIAIFVLFFNLFSINAFAANGPDEDTSMAPKNLDVTPSSGYGQAQTQTSSSDTTSGGTSSSGSSNALYSAVGGTASCSAGQLLGRIIGSSVGQAIGGMTRRLASSVETTVKTILNVPVIDKQNLQQTEASAQNSAALRNKTVGGGNPGGGILAGIVNSINSVSWDGIAYCMVNQMLTYITQSTVQWINNGFKGNPVFVQNPAAMFQQITNGEKTKFINEIKAGFNQGKNGGVNGVVNGTYQIAQPFRNGIYNTIAGYDTQNPFASIPQMSPQLQQNYNAFVTGQSNVVSSPSMALAQISQTNGYVYNGAAQKAIDQQITQAQQIQNSQVVNGYQSFYTCKPGKTQPSGLCLPEDRIITAPAQGIINETNNISNMKYLRISAAKDFDSIVTALINQLMKVAVNKIFEATK